MAHNPKIAPDGTIIIPVQGSYPLRSGETIEIEARWAFSEDGCFIEGEARVTIEGEARNNTSRMLPMSTRDSE